MRDHYAGDISDLLKFALLRALARDDRTIGIAWYYAAGVDKPEDGRHLEWRDDSNWRKLDPSLHTWLRSRSKTVEALEDAAFWPAGTRFHRAPIPSLSGRDSWIEGKRLVLANADLVFLDPDNGIGRPSKKHATLSELTALRHPGRSLGFIAFPHRNSTHADQLQQLHYAIRIQTGISVVRTLRTSVSLPSKRIGQHVPRIRWFAFIDLDTELEQRLVAFANAIREIPRVRAHLD